MALESNPITTDFAAIRYNASVLKLVKLEISKLDRRLSDLMELYRAL